MAPFNRRGLFTLALFSSLFSWLGRAKAAKRRFANIAEFRAFVIAAFLRQPGVDRAVIDPADPAKFEVTIGGTTVTADVTNIFGYLATYPDDDTDRVVERFIRSLIQSGSRAVDDSKIVAVVRTREYIDYFKEKNIDILCEPLGVDLMVTYMMDRPDSMSPITPKDVPGKNLQSLRKIALDNVRQWLPKVVTDNRLRGGVLYVVHDNTMLSPTLILLDEFWKSIEKRFPGDVLIALPRKDQLFIFDDDPKVEAAVRGLIDETIRENFNLLSPNLYARRSSKVVIVTN